MYCYRPSQNEARAKSRLLSDDANAYEACGEIDMPEDSQARWANVHRVRQSKATVYLFMTHASTLELFPCPPKNANLRVVR